MKIFSKKILFAILSAFSGIVAFAQDQPPPPPPPVELPSPELPIDQGLILLFIIALLYGIYIIYNHQIKTKTPI